MIRILALSILLSSCSLFYDFDDLNGLPCGGIACARGYSCLTADGEDGICIAPATRERDDTCSRNLHCKEGLICDNAFCTEGQAECERRCRLGCDPSNLLACASSSELCFPAREEGAQGQGFCQAGNCQAADDCTAGSICVRDAERTKLKGVCAESCDMLDLTSCGAERACAFWFGDLNQAACDVAGDLTTGAQCNVATGTCAPGNICLAQPTAQDPNFSVCVQLCDPTGQRGDACRSPNPGCVPIPGMNLGYCSAFCDPLQPGQCGTTSDGQRYACHPTNNQEFSCGADGSGCACGRSCNPDNAEPGTCAIGAPCLSHNDCPDSTLCSSTAVCRPVCPIRNQDFECQPMPDVAQPQCQSIGNNPTFGVCE